MKSILEVVVMFLISLPVMVGVALPLRHFEQKFCQSWGVEHDLEIRDKTFSLMGCEYYDPLSNSWTPFNLYRPNLETQKATTEKTQKELNKEFFDTHPNYDISDF